MGAIDHNIGRSRIRQLDEASINRIAAGEVVERPASAAKELVENALDAGARRIEIAYAAGGRRLLRVTDDGAGMAPEDLPLALSRHATSKLNGDDLFDIRFFGFRGEALPSLGAVGRLTVTSRAAGCEGASLRVAYGRAEPVRPAALSGGTIVELEALFAATPARLKFLRSDRAEAQAIGDVVRRLALAEPHVAFSLLDVTDGAPRPILELPAETGAGARDARIAALLGAEFAENAVPVDAAIDGFALEGLASLPTYARGAAVSQFLFVNGRPVRDRLLLGALRAAYRDLLPAGRHPAAALFLGCPPQAVDVNVHPAKAEVRFRDAEGARGILVRAVRRAIGEAGPRGATTLAAAALAAARAPAPAAPPPRPAEPPRPARFGQGFDEPAAPYAPPPEEDGARTHPLGAARAQLHGCWILAETEAGLVLVDQHAAHERLVYERLKRELRASGIAAQPLLIPEIVELPAADAARLLSHAEELAGLGLEIEPFGPGAIAVQATPALLGPASARRLVLDVLDGLDAGAGEPLEARLDALLARIACHGSVRAGRRLRADQMNALLREIEATPFSGQCNHGRPTFVELRLADIERLFGRT